MERNRGVPVVLVSFSCLSEFQLNVGKKVVVLCLLMWSLMGLNALAQTLWING